MKTIGSLRRLDPEVKRQIFEAALDSGREQKREKLAEELERELGKKSPSLDYLKKLISQARNHTASRLESSWCLASIEDPPIPPEVLPIILQIWKYRIIEGITIREAKWAGRLYAVVKKRLEEVETRRKNGELIAEDLDFLSTYLEQFEATPHLSMTMTGKYASTTRVDLNYKSDPPLTIPNAFEKALYTYAHRYAFAEMICDIQRRPFDSTGMDKLLMGFQVALKYTASVYLSKRPMVSKPDEPQATGRTKGNE
ncbi:MAG: hypothetical protein ABR958_10365 [Dehalococcoidales bacterium]